MKAIETHYKGHRFRSRLEARWAVFFDALGIDWEYEPEGYMVGPHWPAEATYNGVEIDERKPYLPDFYLPNERLWVEVKGDPAGLQNALLVHASIPGWGLPPVPNSDARYTDDSRDAHYRNSRRVLCLGRIPDDGPDRVFHPTSRFHKGDVVRAWSHFEVGGVETDRSWDHIGGDSGEVNDSVDMLSVGYTAGERHSSGVRAAYTAARKARFEHGESG